MNGKYNSWIISSDYTVCSKLQTILEQNMITTHISQTTIDVVDYLTENKFQFVILDITMPNEDGFRILSSIRRLSDAPVLVLSNQGDITEKKLAISMGADDFLNKPVDPNECLLKAKIHLWPRHKRSHMINRQENSRPVKYSGMVIEPNTRQVIVNGETVNLTTQDFDLLYFLASYPGQVLTYEQIRNHIWNDDVTIDESHAVVSAINRLRKKLNGTDCIKNIRRVGYRFEKI